MKTFSEMMPFEVLKMEEVAEIRGGGADNSGCKSYACPASSATFSACASRTTCDSLAVLPSTPPIPDPVDPIPNPE